VLNDVFAWFIVFRMSKALQGECQDPYASDALRRNLDKMIAAKRLHFKIRDLANIGVGIYLDKLPTNQRGPGDEPPNIKKKWRAPPSLPWSTFSPIQVGSAPSDRSWGLRAVAVLAAICAAMLCL
jgi:hypothetical protein